MTKKTEAASGRVGLTLLAMGAAVVAHSGCALAPGASLPTPMADAAAVASVARITRTANGVAHIDAPDFETLAYGMAYAHAQDNVCQTADSLVTARGERARHFGAAALGQLGLRALPNEQIDAFVAAFIDDTRIARAAASMSAAAKALERGYVAGYNRFLADHGGRLPAPCAGQPWVKPMTLAEYQRGNELSAVLAGSAAFADALIAARPPAAGAAMGLPQVHVALSAQDLAADKKPLASNAWAFGRDTTADGRGLLLGNPHFPWKGSNRFWQVHLTVPGSLDVMGATIGNAAGVVIGFNRDVAWSHTVSTGKRFTLHELTLTPGDPTSYLVDGQREKMSSRVLRTVVRGEDGRDVEKTLTLWSSRYGPLLVAPRLGLNWTAQKAYALQDANSGNMRGLDQWLAYGRARSVQELRLAMKDLGTPWVNTVAADRHGNALYADGSVVPDVDAAQLARCAGNELAQRLLRSASIVVLDGSRADCNWRQDKSSRVPGLIPIERLPVLVRSDWLQNSNDSFVYTHPTFRFEGISPLVGDAIIRSARTRSSHIEVPLMLGRGKATAAGIQQQLFENRNLLGRLVVPDLLAACAGLPDNAAKVQDLRTACAVLRSWDRSSDLDSRGAHLFREFWRLAQAIPGVHRVAFDLQDRIHTPSGLKMDDATVASKVWEALGTAVNTVRAAGFALDAPLRAVQRPGTVEEPVALHGGEPFEGVLNMMSVRATPAIGPLGYQVEYGTSYVQVVGFDQRGPKAQALLVYGQSSDPLSPLASDQLRLYSRKVWPTLPFHAEDVARERVGPLLELRR